MMEAESRLSTVNLGGLRLPWKPALAVVISTLLLIVDFYYVDGTHILPYTTFAEKVRNESYVHLVMYFALPLALIVFAFREKPADYGLTLGDWRTGLKWTLGAWLVATPILYLIGRTPDMVAYYVRYEASPLDVALTALLDLLNWEFFFRGFLLFTLYRIAGPSAVLLQAVPFALAHLTKPPVETLSTIFGGAAFGWLAWRTRSFLYPFLVHWFITTVVIFVAMGAG